MDQNLLYNALVPGFAGQQYQIQQNQALANAMMQKALTPQQGQMISGHYVAPGLNGISEILSGVLANKMRGKVAGQLGNLYGNVMGSLVNAAGGNSAQPGIPMGAPGQPSSGTSLPGAAGQPAQGMPSPLQLGAMQALYGKIPDKVMTEYFQGQNPQMIGQLETGAAQQKAYGTGTRVLYDANGQPVMVPVAGAAGTLGAIEQAKSAGASSPNIMTYTDPSGRQITTTQGAFRSGTGAGVQTMSELDKNRILKAQQATQDLAGFKAMQEPSIANLSLMKQLIPELPSGKVTGTYARLESGMPILGTKYAAARAQWDKYNQQLIQFATRVQALAGGASNAETSHSIIEANGIPFDAPADVKRKTIQALETEQTNVERALQNKAYNLNNLQTPQNEQKLITQPPMDTSNWPKMRGSDGRIYQQNPDNPNQVILVQ